MKKDGWSQNQYVHKQDLKAAVGDMQQFMEEIKGQQEMVFHEMQALREQIQLADEKAQRDRAEAKEELKKIQAFQRMLLANALIDEIEVNLPETEGKPANGMDKNTGVKSKKQEAKGLEGSVTERTEEKTQGSNCMEGEGTLSSGGGLFSSLYSVLGEMIKQLPAEKLTEPTKELSEETKKEGEDK